MLFVWAAIAALSVVSVEVWYRLSSHWSPWMFPANAVIGYVLYQVIAGAPSLIAALVLFSALTMSTRLAASIMVLHEPIVRGQLAAIVLMVLATGVRFLWR